MNLAAVYLQETDQSITQIAGELGYSNISKFARAFQEVFGLPVSYTHLDVYKRQHQC